MNIRTRLTFQFLSIATLIIMVSFVAVYFLSRDYRRADFYERLLKKANITAKLLIEVEEVNAATLYKIEHDNPASLPNEKIIIINYQDSILFSTDENQFLKYDSQLLNRVRIEKEIRFQQGDYEVLGFLFAYKYDRFVVLAAATDIYGKKRISNLTKILMVVLSISILLFWYSGWIYAGRALKPIARIIKEVNEISASSLNLRLHEGLGKDELGQLAHTFNSLLSRLEEVFKTQKDFIANASHELRTPLTSITGQLEYILMKPRTLEEYQKTLLSVFDDIRNLNQLSNRLLLLAHASSEIPGSTLQPLRIDELAWSAREELLKYYPDFTVTIHLDDALDDDTLTIMGDEQLLKTGILNLMENACKYSANHQVIVNFRHQDASIIIYFIDNGFGIPEEDISQITKPFYRGKNVSGYKGTGIGLSLVDRIAIIHHGDLKIESSLNKGTTVILRFPLIEHPEAV